MDPFLLLTPMVDDTLSTAITAGEFAAVMTPLEGAKAVAVALSGGPDSMALLALTDEWARQRNIHVHAVTIDHALRVESADEAQRVHEWVAAYFPYATHEILRRDSSQITPTKLQEQAREDRYDLLASACRAQGIKHLLLAHHQDDQAETFLFRLCKGSGLDGLAAMSAETDIQDIVRVRPLLCFSKARLLATCTARELPYVKDPSNQNAKFARVRLRRVMDMLAQEGLSAQRLAKTSDRLARARQALDHFTDVAWQAALVSDDQTGLVFNFELLLTQPVDIRIRILMRALTQQAGSRDDYGPRLERVEELAQDLFTESGRDGGFTRTTLHHCLIEKSTARGTLSIRPEKS